MKHVFISHMANNLLPSPLYHSICRTLGEWKQSVRVFDKWNKHKRVSWGGQNIGEQELQKNDKWVVGCVSSTNWGKENIHWKARYRTLHLSFYWTSWQSVDLTKPTTLIFWEGKFCLNFKSFAIPSFLKVTLHWVPGHIGIEGDEKAYKFEWKRARTLLVGREPFLWPWRYIYQERV